jgi:oxysterol-binding protein-related protein 8
MYARGILFGKMILELGDTITAKNDKLGMVAEVEFKTKVLLSYYPTIPSY